MLRKCGKLCHERSEGERMDSHEEYSAYGEAGAADLSPAEEVEQAVDAGQLAAHQSLAFHQGGGVTAVQVVDGRHHHHVCRGNRRTTSLHRFYSDLLRQQSFVHFQL